MPHPHIRILFLAFLFALTGCEGGIDDTKAPVYPLLAYYSPYNRAVDYDPSPDRAGAQVTLDACLAIAENVYHFRSDSEYSYQVRAAFNEGSAPVKLDSLSFDTASLTWLPQQYAYEHFGDGYPKNFLWRVSGYSGSFTEPMPTAHGVTLVGPESYSTISKASGATLQYYGAENGTILVEYRYAIDSTDPNTEYKDGQSFRVADNGRIDLSRAMLKDVPAGSWVGIALSHDVFTVGSDARGHRIGLYSIRWDQYFYYIVD